MAFWLAHIIVENKKKGSKIKKLVVLLDITVYELLNLDSRPPLITYIYVNYKSIDIIITTTSSSDGIVNAFTSIDADFTTMKGEKKTEDIKILAKE